MRIRTCAGLLATLLLLAGCSGDEPETNATATTTTTTTIADEPANDDRSSQDAPEAAAFADTGWCANQTKIFELDAQLRDADADTTAAVYAEMLPLMVEFDAPDAIAGDYSLMITNTTAFADAVTEAGLSNIDGLGDESIERLLFANNFLNASTNVFSFSSTNC